MRLSRLFPEAREMVDDSLDYLIRVIGPRDPWMHRLDVARASGREVKPDEHDAKIVEQVVRDLAQTWTGPPVKLHLSSAEFLVGQGNPAATIEHDGFEFCRLMSGRPAASPEVTGDAAVAGRLLSARVVF